MSSQTARDQLIQQITTAIYESSTTAVFFHSAIADYFGLGTTEEKTLLMLSSGARTAGEIAQFTGLTTASVTSLIDRMEEKGFVHRQRDSADRRKVIVVADAQRIAELMELFTLLGESFAGMFDEYDDVQLTLIVDFLNRMTINSQAAVERLNRL